MALAKGKIRLSCDYPKDVYNEFDKIAEKAHKQNPKINKNYILNELVKSFVLLDDDTIVELVGMLKAKEQLHLTKAENSASFFQQKEYDIAKKYEKLAYIYSHFGEIGLINDDGMIRYELSNGCVVVPEKWIAIKPEVSKDHTYAWVLEIKKDNQSCENNLYFIGFFDSQRIDSESEKQFIEEVRNIYPNLTELEKMYVEPKYSGSDEHENKEFINEKEWDVAHIGVFNIKEFDEKKPNIFYPYGAMIIR